MFASIASLFDFDIVLNGEGSILSRPMDFIDMYLPRLGVDVKSTEGKIPITLRGPLKPKNIRVSGALSSQFLTGLLFAFCHASSKPTTITVDNLTSRPYIDLTISVLKEFGFQVVNNDYQSFDVLPIPKDSNRLVRYKVEGDWSNAAFLLVAGAISGDITLKGMNMNSVQGDKSILKALYKSNADVKLNKESITVRNTNQLKAFEFDATQCPDLFPPLVALASYCTGISRIQGVHRLLHKESNRAIALRDEFGKMNVGVEINGNEMLVTGTNKVKGAKVSSHNDHRIAMAATIGSLRGHGVTEIADAEAVNKSYPGFYEDMKRIGVSLIKL
jgi:3-phosphoshikimate 1-carboxyvinyltransferase